jgi:23S rRNA maturation-related 3'-5' exoribonuclease YhaM
MCSKTQYANVESNKATTVDLLSMIERPGMENLIDHLLNSDYFTAPASTRYHNSFTGGLCLHSLKVMKMFSDENKLWEKSLPQDSVILCGLLHDLCKIGMYSETDDGYLKRKDLPAGHGTLSVSRIEEHVKLTVPEKDVILCHMSLFGAYQYRDFKVWDLHRAIIRTPQVQVFAAIDMADSRRKVDASHRRRI